MARVLIVGGTGMLRPLAITLSRRGDEVLVSARSRAHLHTLAHDALPAKIGWVASDWHDSAGFERELAKFLRSHGAITAAVCWVHSDAPGAMPTIARLLSTGSPGARVFHIVGSEGTPPEGDRRTREFAATFPALRWRRIVLGHIALATGWRWLTHDEVSEGVLRAIDLDAPESVVGMGSPAPSDPC